MKMKRWSIKKNSKQTKLCDLDYVNEITELKANQETPYNSIPKQPNAKG
jgi:hypothetical protein